MLGLDVQPADVLANNPQTQNLNRAEYKHGQDDRCPAGNNAAAKFRVKNINASAQSKQTGYDPGD